MVQLEGNEQVFAQLFADSELSPQKLYGALDDTQFEHFVEYVFQQAGFGVEYTALHHGNGLDLKLYAWPGGQRLHAGVQVKHYLPDITKVTAPQVVSLRGGLPQTRSVTGYLVTTSTFNDPALTEAKHDRRIWPLDGEHFVRYIKYVRGSRVSAQAEQENIPYDDILSPVLPETLFIADQIVRRPAEVTRVLTVANHKGGVGKTTTALNLAFGLAGQDKQVLLVDMDPQANLTRALAHPQAVSALSGHLGDYYAGTRPLAELVRPTQFKRVWLIPSDHALARLDRGISAGADAELQFTLDLHAPELKPPPVLDARPFDWIIIDTGPNMGFFTRSALAASHSALVPISPSVFADLGVEYLLETLETMRALSGSPVTLLGSLITQWKDDVVSRALVASAEAVLGYARIPRLKPEIPLDRSNIERAHLQTGQGKRRNLLDRRCASAKAYLSIVDELLK